MTILRSATNNLRPLLIGSGVVMVLSLLGALGLAILTHQTVNRAEEPWRALSGRAAEVEARSPPADSSSHVVALTTDLSRTSTLTGLVVVALSVALLSLTVTGSLLRQARAGAPDGPDHVAQPPPVSACQELINTIPQGLLVHRAFRPLFVNPALARMFGFDNVEQAMAHDTFLSFVGERERPLKEDEHARILSGEIPTWSGRFQFFDRDGNSLWIEEHARQIQWCDGPAVQTALIDITDRVLHEQDTEMERSVTERQAREMVALAEELDAALQLAEEHKARLHTLSISDSLTGAFNRRHFMDCANEELARQSRQRDRPVAVAMLDIDHFKAINDTYGHAAGDDALRVVTACCRTTLRTNDLFGRLGGEEFAVLLPNTDLDGAVTVAERLRVALASERITLDDGRTFGLTASFGVTVVDDPTAPIDVALNRADTALYQSKTNGRDRVTVAPPPLNGSTDRKPG
jgi:diguanylate cyclase (GGDEF)-like protein/PAS domain S-box-containing protein